MNSHPVQMLVSDDLQRSRATTFFRPLLVIPHLMWSSIWSMGAAVVFLVSWIATLIKGTSPEGMHNFLAAYLRYATRVNSYMSLGANAYPPFNSTDPYAVELVVAPPARQKRWGVFFRVLLAYPAMILSAVLGLSMAVATTLGWFFVMGKGRMPRGLCSLVHYSTRYTAQVSAYSFLLTSRYPDSDPRVHTELGALQPASPSQLGGTQPMPELTESVSAPVPTPAPVD